MALIDHLGLNGYVCPLLPPRAPYNPTCKVMISSAYPSQYSWWWTEIWSFLAKQQYLHYMLTGKLSVEIYSCLLPAHRGPFNFPVWTACDILNWLWKRYSVKSALSVQKIKDLVLFFMCMLTAIFAYVQQWHNAINQLFVMAWDLLDTKRYRNLLMKLLTCIHIFYYKRRFNDLEMLDLEKHWTFIN